MIKNNRWTKCEKCGEDIYKAKAKFHKCDTKTIKSDYSHDTLTEEIQAKIIEELDSYIEEYIIENYTKRISKIMESLSEGSL
jgi:hypothetical protein